MIVTTVWTRHFPLHMPADSHFDVGTDGLNPKVVNVGCSDERLTEVLWPPCVESCPLVHLWMESSRAHIEGSLGVTYLEVHDSSFGSQTVEE